MTRSKAQFWYFLLLMVAFADGLLIAGVFDSKQTKIEAGELTTLESIFEVPEVQGQLSVQNEVPFITPAFFGLQEEPWSSLTEEAIHYMIELWQEGETRPELSIVATELQSEERFRLQGSIFSGEPEAWRAALRGGALLIFEVDGAVLANPNYADPAPKEHQILVIGYDEDGSFFAHDPGTIRGEATRYSEETLKKALEGRGSAPRIVKKTIF